MGNTTEGGKVDSLKNGTAIFHEAAPNISIITSSDEDAIPRPRHIDSGNGSWFDLPASNTDEPPSSEPPLNAPIFNDDSCSPASLYENSLFTVERGMQDLTVGACEEVSYSSSVEEALYTVANPNEDFLDSLGIPKMAAASNISIITSSDEDVIPRPRHILDSGNGSWFDLPTSNTDEPPSSEPPLNAPIFNDDSCSPASLYENSLFIVERGMQDLTVGACEEVPYSSSVEEAPYTVANPNEDFSNSLGVPKMSVQSWDGCEPTDFSAAAVDTTKSAEEPTDTTVQPEVGTSVKGRKRGRTLKDQNDQGGDKIGPKQRRLKRTADESAIKIPREVELLAIPRFPRKSRSGEVELSADQCVISAGSIRLESAVPIFAVESPHLATFPIGSFLIRISELDDGVSGDVIWRVCDKDIFIKYILKSILALGLQLYKRTELFVGWSNSQIRDYRILAKEVVGVTDDYSSVGPRYPESRDIVEGLRSLSLSAVSSADRSSGVQLDFMDSATSVTAEGFMCSPGAYSTQRISSAFPTRSTEEFNQGSEYIIGSSFKQKFSCIFDCGGGRAHSPVENCSIPGVRSNGELVNDVRSFVITPVEYETRSTESSNEVESDSLEPATEKEVKQGKAGGVKQETTEDSDINMTLLHEFFTLRPEAGGVFRFHFDDLEPST